MVAAGEPGGTSGTSAHPRAQPGVSLDLVLVLYWLRIVVLVLDQLRVLVLDQLRVLALVHLLVFLPQ